MPQNFIAPTPPRWAEPVIAILEGAEPEKIDWTARALGDLRQIGFASKFAAYKHCLTVLHTPNIIGKCVVDMRTVEDDYSCDAWAFLCPHPLGSPKPLCVKIGLHQDQLQIDLFSLHVDLTGEPQERITAFLEKKK